MVNVCGVPLQPLTEGVTVMLAVTAAGPLFTAVNCAISPFPVAANPMDGELFVQSKEVALTVPAKPTDEVNSPLHKVCGFTVATLGVGFTMMVNVSGAPVQLFADGVTVMVADTAVIPVLVAVNEAIFPFPVAANPIDEVLFVQSKDVPATVSTKLMAVVGAPLHNV